jgi:phosphatidylglycerophosphate synthase
MLDGVARRLIGPPIEKLGRKLAARGVKADHITWAGFLHGILAAAAIAAGLNALGLLLLLTSRLCDGLDGAVARASVKTDRGGFLDIVLDFAFYGAIPLAFAIADPERNALAAAALLFAFYANGASFLGYAVIAAKRGLEANTRGEKSLYFTTGLAEATETILVFVLFCLFPAAFVPIAYVFGALTLVTAAGRILLAMRTFG